MSIAILTDEIHAFLQSTSDDAANVANICIHLSFHLSISLSRSSPLLPFNLTLTCSVQTCQQLFAILPLLEYTEVAGVQQLLAAISSSVWHVLGHALNISDVTSIDCNALQGAIKVSEELSSSHTLSAHDSPAPL